MENVNCRFQGEVRLATASPGTDGLAPEAEALLVGRRWFLVPGGPAPEFPRLKSGASRGPKGLQQAGRVARPW